MSSVRYLSVQEVIAINVAMIQHYSPGEQIGVKEPGLLESAVHRPQSSAFGEEAYVFAEEASILVCLYKVLLQPRTKLIVSDSVLFNLFVVKRKGALE